MYGIYQNKLLLFICEDEGDAQEMILSLTQEFIYHGFLRELNNCGLDMALWLFRNAPHYGWHKYLIKPIKRA